MSDYAFYIWSAYGAAALAIGALIAHHLLDYRAQRRALQRLEGDAARHGS
ncbi:heme exporter protein CcmD [Enterovirga rhinocerotis]|uniref:Heme exporter protein D n=1 Tax=Enterovirga rhinocerotis TaxID=1339210 RepID=A0A4R7BP58_9HYPH|nr:heme exporter protein CcmD [Enterovirga rhinocerotis]TDR87350.1 heme exporter protein D [Enterovirga rhinocerotis]